MRRILILSFLTTVIASSFFLDYSQLLLDFLLYNNKKVLEFVDSNFFPSLIAFTIIYCLSTALSFPIGSFLSLMGGYLFSAVFGFFAVVIGASLGAMLLFFIVSRNAKISFSLGNNSTELFVRFKSGLEKNIWSYLFLIRFVPIFPFWFVNIAPAVLGVKLLPYMITTFFGIMPGTFFICSIGSELGNSFGQEMFKSSDVFKNKNMIFCLSGLGLIAVSPIMYNFFRRRKP